MTGFELDQRAHQRVMDFLSFRSDEPHRAGVETQHCSEAVAEEIPASIAQNTAADLMRFLQGEHE